MKAQELLDNLVSRGMILFPNGNKLSVAPRELLTDEDRTHIRQFKPELMMLVGVCRLLPTDLPLEWHQVWEERAAILEFEGRHHREHAESIAMVETVRMMQKGKESPRCAKPLLYVDANTATRATRPCYAWCVSYPTLVGNV